MGDTNKTCLRPARGMLIADKCVQLQDTALLGQEERLLPGGAGVQFPATGRRSACVQLPSSAARSRTML